MATKPGYRVRVEVKDKDTAAADAAITIMEAALTAYDANVSFTNETLGGDKVAFSFDLDYVDFQSAYGQTLMGLLFAFARAYVLVPSVLPIDITI